MNATKGWQKIRKGKKDEIEENAEQEKEIKEKRLKDNTVETI